MNNREELKKHLEGICPPLQNLDLRSYQDTLADFITEQTRLARIDELKELQMAPNVPDDAKDSNYLGYIKERIGQLAPKPKTL